MSSVILDGVTTSDPLVSLVQKDNFIGWIYSMDYDQAQLMTNDEWKLNVKGIPHNSFLVATSFDPDNFSETLEEDKEVILLRVIGTSKLPQDEDIITAKIDNYQNQTRAYLKDKDKDFDKITKSKIQFGGLMCRVLGTFYMKNNYLYLGSDIESFYVSLRMNVYIPKGEALKTIINYVDPIRKRRSKDYFTKLGITKDVQPFKIGTIRYTSSDRLHRGNDDEKVPFYIQPTDFLARRTAVLGMTRTGKSNMIKQTVSVVKGISKECTINIGQLVYDLNGEYANANQQDDGAISNVHKEDCVRYRMIKTEGFNTLLNNFYEQILEGYAILKEEIKQNANASSTDVKSFLNLSFDEPDKKDRSLYNRWQKKIALYKVVLYAAGYEIDSNYKVYFDPNKDVREKVAEKLDPKCGISLREAKEWFLKARSIRDNLKTSSGDSFFDDDEKAMLNLLACKNEKGSYINGYKVLFSGRKYHSPERSTDVAKEIYDLLENGKIVILDLSVGNAVLRDKLSKNIAEYIFERSMIYFTEGKTAPYIAIYIEEAHNLIGKGMELTETWPRLAKEGSKYNLALIYATQEVSSIHPNILANTENWFVSHLNSEKEVRELARFYDFDDFRKSLLRAQDVGFTRVKTLSSPYVIPIQVDKFEPKIR